MKGMNKSGVPWADYRWNPIEGCSPASEGCERCYAAALAHRFHRPWGQPVFRPERLHQPLHTNKPGKVFVCSTSDLYHSGVDLEWQRKIWDVMAMAYQHKYLILTKRPERIRLLDVEAWLGVTTENQTRYNERWPLISTINRVRFVSVEPMLGPITLRGLEKRPQWVICGPENGRGARPCDPDWIQALADECEEYSIPFFDKRDNGIRRESP